MRSRTALAVGALLVVATAAVGAGVAAAASTTLELQETETGESDSATLSYTITVGGEGTTSVSISPDSETRDFGDVEYQFDSWEDLDSSDSGTGTSFTGTAGHTYRIVYEVTAFDGADEGTYTVTSTASTGNGKSVSEDLTTTVEVRSPQFGSIDTKSQTITFHPGDGDTDSNSKSVDVENVGDGKLEYDTTSVSGVDPGMTVTVTDEPGTIDAGSSGSLELDIEVSSDMSEGTHQFDVTLEDSVGNTETFPVDVVVDKPPSVGASPNRLKLGDVMVGSSASGTVTVSETGGYDSLDGLSVALQNDESLASIDTSSLESVSLAAGGSADREVSISVGSNAEQHEELDWEVELTPDESSGRSATFDVSARVIYPPYFESLSLSDTTIEFDEPRDETTEFTKTVSATVTNGGDRDMTVTDTEVSVSGSGVTATVQDPPDTIPAQSSETVDVRLVADADATEGERQVSLSVTGQQPGTETTTATVDVEHQAVVNVSQSRVDFGEAILTQESSRTVRIRETLGYEDVQSFDVARASGPDRGWLSVVQRPESLAAGDAAPLVLSLQFDTEAQLYQQYGWTFRVTGDNVDATTVRVVARARPVSVDKTVERLRAFESGEETARDRVAATTADALVALESQLRSSPEQAALKDITTVSTYGRSVVLFLESTASARESMDAGNYAVAQRNLTRAAAAYNTMTQQVETVRTPSVKQTLNRSQSQAGQQLNALIDRQRTHYQERMDGENTTMLETARLKQQLARLAALSGNTQRAQRLRSESETALERYASLVSTGNERLQQARDHRDDLDQGPFLTVGGQRLFWIGQLSTVDAETSDVLETYGEAQQRFETAGADERAATVRAERQQLAQSYATARTLSLGIGGVVGLLFLALVAIEARSLYRYVQESKEAMSGDFLVSPADTK